jgi:hypothetical protein
MLQPSLLLLLPLLLHALLLDLVQAQGQAQATTTTRADASTMDFLKNSAREVMHCPSKKGGRAGREGGREGRAGREAQGGRKKRALVRHTVQHTTTLLALILFSTRVSSRHNFIL